MNAEKDRESLIVINMMRDEDSRKFIWKLLQSYGTFNSTFDPDPITHARRAGLRDAGLQLERSLKEHALEDYFKMIRENEHG